METPTIACAGKIFIRQHAATLPSLHCCLSRSLMLAHHFDFKCLLLGRQLRMRPLAELLTEAKRTGVVQKAIEQAAVPVDQD